MNLRPLVNELKRDLVGISTTPEDDSAHLNTAVDWLFQCQDVADNDGCAATYNLVLGWEPAYPETTGYIIPTLYEYDKRTSSAEARARAERMAIWLLTTQLDSGAFPAGKIGDETPEPSVFNTGQILLGLARAYQETDDETFSRALCRGADWLVSEQRDGYWQRHVYKNTVHTYTARVGWALAVAARISGDEGHRRGAARNLEWVRDEQRENATFRKCAFVRGKNPFLHTIAYTVRGLIEGGEALNDSKSLQAGRRTADKLLQLQRTSGPLKGAYDADWNGASYHCLTGNAQMATVWLRLHGLTGKERYYRAARRELAFLKTKQRLDGPPEVQGGLKGSHPVWGPYLRMRYPNWAAKFLADALLLSATRGATASPAKRSYVLIE